MEGKRRIMLGSNNYLGRTTDPVSYTHLDVYKRQAIIIANVAGLAHDQRVLLIQASLVMSAVTTLLQLFPLGGHDQRCLYQQDTLVMRCVSETGIRQHRGIINRDNEKKSDQLKIFQPC